MSYPNTSVAERWVPINSKGGDPVVLFGIPYVVLLGYVAGDCPPRCPEYETKTIDDVEYYWTTVHTSEAREGFTVTVNAEAAIQFDQMLYVHGDSVPGNVILTNVNTGNALPAWGRVFAFGNDDGWLSEGDVNVIGMLDATILGRDVAASANSNLTLNVVQS